MKAFLLSRELLLFLQKFSPLAHSHTSKGFTLVELMVVIVILAILSVVGITVFSNMQAGARDAKRQADIKAIANVLESNYIASAGRYPAVSTSQFAGGSTPTDPGSTNYTGLPSGIVTSYNVCAYLETKSASYCLKNQR